LESCCSVMWWEEMYTHFFLFGDKYTRKCLTLEKEIISSRWHCDDEHEMIWEAKGRKDEKKIHNACVENIFYIRTFSALEIFSAFFSPPHDATLFHTKNCGT
jgi:hypothetical protein